MFEELVGSRYTTIRPAQDDNVFGVSGHCRFDCALTTLYCHSGFKRWRTQSGSGTRLYKYPCTVSADSLLTAEKRDKIRSPMGLFGALPLSTRAAISHSVLCCTLILPAIGALWFVS